MSKKLTEHTDEELIAELVRRFPPQPAPSQVTYLQSTKCSVLPVGKDHHADLVIGEEDLNMLHSLIQLM